MLVEDVHNTPVAGLEDIFADCEGLVRSCALLPLVLDSSTPDHAMTGALLAFGVRHPGRFQPNQGVVLLTFLSRIVAHRLEAHLTDLAL